MNIRMKIGISMLLASILFAVGVLMFFYSNDLSKPVTAMAQTSPPQVSAKNAILIDDKGTVLFEKNADEKAYPASTTKIMTAITAIDICSEYDIDFDEELEIDKAAIGVEGSSIYLKPGDRKSIINLLYGTMLRSGNDGATALAIGLGGNLDHFIYLMNEKAGNLGCMRTNFVNPTGLFDENHYTTARDLSIIAQYAMKNDLFREIAGAKEYENYSNKNKTVYQYEGATGIKIGYTENSGRTLVASAKRNGRELICVVLADPNWFDDAYALMDYGFARLEEESEQ